MAAGLLVRAQAPRTTYACRNPLLSSDFRRIVRPGSTPNSTGEPKKGQLADRQIILLVVGFSAEALHKIFRRFAVTLVAEVGQGEAENDRLLAEVGV